MMLKKQSGFTLIELLIVIVIIGLLAGVLISVINPVQQQNKARQTTVRSNVEKICLAMSACAVSHSTNVVSSCDSLSEIGVNDPTGVPTSSTYGITVSSTTLQATGTLGTCTFQCDYDTATGASVATRVTGTCVID
jgi:prepilin-type N-terminal cleavage/methylation domain-containing protein